MLKDVLGTWYDPLKHYVESSEMQELGKFLVSRQRKVEVFPKPSDRFRAFQLTQFEDVKVVILGQDPYHTPNVANGLAFAINYSLGCKIPPSLRNIEKELEQDVHDGLLLTMDYTLESWAKQGVLLINTALTVEKGDPGSHAEKWENFTREVIKSLNGRDIVYILWGNHAKSYKVFIDGGYVIESAHPSPFSANKGFFGSKPFTKCNEYLKSSGNIIEW